MRKFLDDVIGPLRVPSHRRYLQYFAGLLSNQIIMNSEPLFLQRISVQAPPTWLNYSAGDLASGSGEWRTFVKVYEGLSCVFTSDVHVVPVSTRQFVFEVAGRGAVGSGGHGHGGQQLRLRGDVIVRCYQIVPSRRPFEERRELILSAQFHTCAVTERTVAFGRAELDYACDGECAISICYSYSLREARLNMIYTCYSLQIRASPTTTRSHCTLRRPLLRRHRRRPSTTPTMYSKVRW